MKTHSKQILDILNNVTFKKGVAETKQKYQGNWNELSKEEYSTKVDQVVDLLRTAIQLENFDKLPVQCRNSIHSIVNQIFQQIQQARKPNAPQNIVQQFDQLELHMLQWGLVLPNDVDITSFENRVVILKNQLDENETTMKKSFAAFQSSIDQLQQSTHIKRNEFDKQLVEIRQNFSETTKNLQTQYNTVIETAKSEFEILKDELRLQNESFKVDEKKSLKEILSEAREDAASIKSLAGKKAGDKIAGGFNEAANHERKSKWFWQAIFLVSVSLIVLASYKIFFPDSQNDSFDTSNILCRFLISIPLGIIATFAARSAKNHDLFEKRFRQKELDLRAINPFISRLDKNKQDKIIEAMSMDLFNRDDSKLEMERFKENLSVIDEILKVVKSFRLDEELRGNSKSGKGKSAEN